MSYLKRVVLAAIVSITIAFILMIILVSKVLSSDSYSVIFVYIIATCISVFVTFGILIITGYKISRPIKSLINYAQLITKNYIDVMKNETNFTLPQTLPPLHYKMHKKNEMALLWNTFTKMLEVIQENFSIIEKRVHERTEDLYKHSTYIKLLIDDSVNIYLLIDKNMNIAYCSVAVLELFNLKNFDDIIGKPFIYISDIHPDREYAGRSLFRFSRIINGEEFLIEDDFVNWPEQGIRSYHITYKRIVDKDNNFGGIVITLMDTTKVRIQEAERRMNDMLQSTLMPCLIFDKNGNIIKYNKMTSLTFGLSSYLSIKEFSKLFLSMQPKYQPDGQMTKDIGLRVINEALTQGFAHSLIQLMDNTGNLLHFEINLTRISRLTDHFLFAIFNDMNEIMLKEAEAKEAEERIRLMLDSNPLICILKDEQANIVDCNKAALNLLNIPNKTDFYKNISNFFPEFQPDGTRSVDREKEIIQTVKEKGLHRLERTFRAQSGEIIPVESEIVRIPWKNSYYYLSYSRDLREIKAKEKKIQESMARERELEIQKNAAQAANEAKSRFLANMSHEIRTPMNAILGMAELLLSEKLNSRQFQYVKDIKTSGNVLLDIINDILDVSKIQSDKLSLIPVHYDFNTFISNIASIAHFLIEDKDIIFKLDIQDQIPKCLYGDDIRLRQILLNLLSNAIKFTSEGFVCLSIKASDTKINFTVRDTGIGIESEYITKLFEVFEQFDILRNRNLRGTGLGLSITKSLVEMMDGQITVESEYGKGSSFHVEIPIVIGDETLIFHADSQEMAIYAPDAKILVVDDNKTNLNVACGLLQLYKITTETATSGEQAIEMIKQNQYDIVFMDYRMPGISGVEATKIIRELDINVPIIALTASVVMGAKSMMLEAGMDDYLSKPIIKKDLSHILKKWLPDEKLLSSAPEPAVTDGPDENDKHKKFWKKIEQIEGLSLSMGLSRVEGQQDVYEKTLKLMIEEIEKCIKNLNDFLTAEDMQNFCIEVHSIKSALANTGVMELSDKARELETASEQGDIAFCASNLQDFTERLESLNFKLKEAFAELKQNQDTFEIPPELELIFEKLQDAIDKMDFEAIDNEISNIDALNLSRALKEEIGQIQDAVLIMEYERAISVMQKLLSRKRN